MYDNKDYEDAVRAANLRKKKAAALKKRRQKQLMIIKRRIVCGMLAIILVVSVICLAKNIKPKDKKASIEQKEVLGNVQEAVDEQDVNKTEKKIKFDYPTRAQSYVVMGDNDIKSTYISLLDVSNNQIIAGKDPDAKIYPASMTKVMSLIVAVENISDLNEKYTFNKTELNDLYLESASVAGFSVDESVKAIDLLYGLILPSGADAAGALAKMASGSEESFVALMNAKCEELGLKNTHFCNPSGLHDENQYTTSTEMAMIMSYAMKNVTCAKVLSTYQYTTDATPQHPEGILLTSTMFSRMYGTEVEGVTIKAGKTGYTDQAHNCLVSYAVKDGKEYIAVTAAAGNRWHVIFDDFYIYERYLP